MQISEHYWWVPLVVMLGGLLSVTVILFVRKKIVPGTLLGAITFLYFLIALPGAKPARPQAQINACVANTKILNASVEAWAAANGKQAGDDIDYHTLTNYVKGGIIPRCPRGGFYVFKKVGTKPECSLPEHVNATMSINP